MADDNLGTAGGKAPAPYLDPVEPKTPKTGGYDSAPKGEAMDFEALHGFGGSTPGAH